MVYRKDYNLHLVVRLKLLETIKCVTSTTGRSSTLIIESTSATATGILIHLGRCLSYVNLS